MGSAVSYVVVPKGWDIPDPVTGLSPHHRQAIYNTWALIQPQLKATGIALFLALFKAYPEHQARFAAFAAVPYSELHNNKRFIAHASNVVHAVAAVVDSLDDPECLREMLIKVAVSHKARNIPPKAYHDLKEVFLNLLKVSLGYKLTPTAEEAWEIAFTHITDIICQHL